MMFIKKDGPPLIIEVYVDGRAEVYIPTPPKLREKILSRMFQNSVKKEGIQNIKPGRYHFNYTKIGFMSLEAELASAE
jgi:hypothetical protein